MSRSPLILCTLALAASLLLFTATAEARPMTLGHARAAIFERALDVSFSPQFLSVDTLTDIRRPRPTRITGRHICFQYRFTIAAGGMRLYDERGTGCVTARGRATLKPTGGSRAPSRDLQAA